MTEFVKQVAEYGEELEDFRDFYEMPDEWFSAPDHVAVKASGPVNFEMLIEDFREQALNMSCIDIDRRRLATASLIVPITIASLGEVELIEIMEPRPEKIGKDLVGVEHMEFTFPDFEVVRHHLEERNVLAEIQSNSSHKWLNIVINDHGQELKFNDKPLSKIVQQELEEGIAYLL